MTDRVVVIGDALLDVHVAHTDPIRHGGDIPAEIRIGPGGQGANLAVRLARRGVDVELICALGPDPAADLVRDALRADGVRLHELPVAETGTVLVLVDATGERSMLSRRVAFADRALAALPPEAAWLVLSGYLLLEPSSLQLADALAVGAARRALVGCAVPEASVEVWRSGSRAMRPDLVVLNREEIHLLDPVSGPLLAVTDSAGATLTIGDQRLASPTPTGPPAIDTTGAGDAFAAALVAGMVGEAWPPTSDRLRHAIRDATELAAAVARARGAQARVVGEGPARLGT